MSNDIANTARVRMLKHYHERKARETVVEEHLSPLARRRFSQEFARRVRETRAPRLEVL